MKKELKSGILSADKSADGRPTVFWVNVIAVLVMKIFLRPFFLFRRFKKSICQLMAKWCTLSPGKLPRGGLPKNSVDRITDRPDMTSAVYRGRKEPTKTNKQALKKTVGR